MGFWFQGKKGSEAQDFGKSTKKARKSRLSFMLEEIITPSALIPSVQDTDPLRHFLGSLPLSDWNLGHLIGLVGRVWVHLLQDVGNSLHFMADAGGTCPTTPTPTGDLPPLIDLDPLGLRHDGIPTQVPGTPGGAWDTLTPPFMMPLDPPGDGQVNKNQLIAIDPKLLDFPLASQPIVGAIDTGVSANNPYIANTNLKKGHDYVDGDDDPLLQPGEGSEHGTFIVGILDSINKNAPKWVGRAIGSGKWDDSLREFVDAAKASGQKNAIINLSLDLTQVNPDGSVTTRYEFTPQERSAIEYARQNGVMIVVAAGNDGDVMSVLGQASQELDNIITVGSGNINGRDSHSSYGRGLNIMADGGTTENPILSTVGSGLGTMAGTSVATAKVTGAASLVWAANPDLSYRQVIEILEKTARDLGTPGWDDETGFGLLNTLAAVQLAKNTTPEVYNPTPWYAPDGWDLEGKVTPEERAAKGGNSIATATVQVSTNFSDSDRFDSTQPEKYYQFTVNEPGYVRWNFTSLNPVSGAGRPDVTIIKADGSSASHRFHKGASIKSFVGRQGQTSFSDGDFYDPGTYYLKVGNSPFKDYNISTQFIADGVSSFAGNIQYRTQPYKSLDNSSPNAIFSGPTVSELKNLSGQVTYNPIDYNTRIAKYGFEVNESGKFRINLNSPNGKMELNIYKFIGSEDKPVHISGLGGVSANSDQWLEVDLNKGRYDIEVKTPNDNWLEPDWNSTQTLVRPYTLNATFTPNAPQPGQGKVPSSAGVFDKTVVSNNGVVNHYYANGYLTVQPSGQASWYGYAFGVVSTSVQRINEPVPLIDPDGNYSIPTSKVIFASVDLNDGIDHKAVGGSIGGNLDREDYYRFTLDKISDVDIQLSGDNANAKFYLAKDVNGNGKIDYGEALQGANQGNNIKNISRSLGPGTYYVVVSSDDRVNQTKYNLNVDTKPETAGNSLLYAQDIGLLNGSKTFKGLVDTKVDTYDYYRFNLDETSNVNLKLDKLISAPFADIDGVSPFVSVELINLTTGEILQSAAGNSSSAASINRLLQAGSYYVRVNSSETNGYASYELSLDGEPAYKKPIDAEYARYQGLLGSPTGGYWQAADSPNGTKGYGQNYAHGHVFWTAQSGAIALWHGFANTYNQNSGSNGWLGFPTQGKRDWEGGQRIDFEGGYIYWTEKEGAKAYHPWETPQNNLNNTVGYDGANTHQTYVNTFNNNGGSSALGFATGNVHPAGTGNGYLQEFSGGSEGSGAIMKSGANDNSFWVGSDFWNTYIQTGGVTGVLGYPISNRYEFNGGWKQDFQGGSLSTSLPLTPAPNSGKNTSPQAPQIINRNGESGTGKLIKGMNFRNYPWTDSSSLIQGMSVGTTFTILEKVTTTADPNLTHSDWYRVRLNDGREGYFWAGEEFIQKVASGGGSGPIGVGRIGVTPIKEGPIGVGRIRVTPIDNSNDNTSVFPSISIASAYDANDGDNFVVAGSKIILSGKSNSQNIRFYLGDIPLTQGNINRDFDSENFSATLTIPPGVLPGSYQVKAVVNSPTGDATSSGLLINVQETDYYSKTDPKISLELGLESLSWTKQRLEQLDWLIDNGNQFEIPISTDQDDLLNREFANRPGTGKEFNYAEYLQLKAVNSLLKGSVDATTQTDDLIENYIDSIADSDTKLRLYNLKQSWESGRKQAVETNNQKHRDQWPSYFLENLAEGGRIVFGSSAKAAFYTISAFFRIRDLLKGAPLAKLSSYYSTQNYWQRQESERISGDIGKLADGMGWLLSDKLGDLQKATEDAKAGNFSELADVVSAIGIDIMGWMDKNLGFLRVIGLAGLGGDFEEFNEESNKIGEIDKILTGQSGIYLDEDDREFLNAVKFFSNAKRMSIFISVLLNLSKLAGVTNDILVTIESLIKIFNDANEIIKEGYDVMRRGSVRNSYDLYARYNELYNSVITIDREYIVGVAEVLGDYLARQ